MHPDETRGLTARQQTTLKQLLMGATITEEAALMAVEVLSELARDSVVSASKPVRASGTV
jgi:hypothetical protein